MKVLVTGHSGYIGAVLTPMLLDAQTQLPVLIPTSIRVVISMRVSRECPCFTKIFEMSHAPI